MKIIFTTPILEAPPAGGPQLRIENSIKALSLVSELHVLSRVTFNEMGGQFAYDFYLKTVKFFTFTPVTSARNFLINCGLGYSLLSRILFKLSKIIINFFYSEARYICSYARKNNIQVIWFGYGNISYDLMKKVKSINPSLKLVCDTDSVWSRFVLRELPFESILSKREKIRANGIKKLNEEIDWVEFCDITTAVSEIDLKFYKEISFNAEKIHLFSNVIDIDNYTKNVDPPLNFKNPSIYLAGSFGPNSSMDKAARWVISKVFPLILQKYPKITFYIVGNGSIETLSDVKHPNIHITGKLSSVLPYLKNSTVALVPLMFESGTRYKIIEAAACGIPIVSTTLGAEGIPVEHNKNIIIADTPEDFANGIIKIIENPEFALNLAKECKKLIQEFNSVESLAKEAKVIIKMLKV
jgi:glycosyltransferase involved in cell wall biosynthesis